MPKIQWTDLPPALCDHLFELLSHTATFGGILTAGAIAGSGAALASRRVEEKRAKGQRLWSAAQGAGPQGDELDRGGLGR